LATLTDHMGATNPTAQDLYTSMLRSAIAPRLRALGFKGSGNSYVLPDHDRWLILAFQKDRYSTAASILFTVNLTSADKHAWAAAQHQQKWVPTRPSGTLRYLWAEVVRLGALIPPGHDRWWEVAPGRARDAAAAEVLDAIERFALPWLRRMIPPAAGSLQGR
jgi:uncharacterized protein DUF4304